MAHSYFDYKGTGTTIQTDILCVSTEHMYALKVLSEEASNITLSDVALAATFTKNNAGVLCELKTAPSTKIRVIRSTPYDVLMHDFSNGAQFNADSVDEVYEQLLYLCQEIVEGKLIIDNSGNFGGTSAVYISPNELQKQIAAGTAAGEAAGKAVGYAEGYARGDAEGYTRGEAACSIRLNELQAQLAAQLAAQYSLGYSDGDAAGYARGYSEGYAAGYSEGKAAGYSEGKAAGDAEGYARGYAEGKAAGSGSSGSGSGGSGGSGSGGGGSGGSTPVKTRYSIYYGLLSKHSDDRSQICTGSIGDIKLTGQSQGYCTGVDSYGYNKSLAIHKTTY